MSHHIEAITQEQRWKGQGFARVNQAVWDSDLIPELNELFIQNSLKATYLIFDGMETSYVFSVPARTRYILPIFENDLMTQVDIYPGMLVSEILGFRVRNIEFQIGLDQKDLTKLTTRRNVALREPLEEKQPDWWIYPYPAVDLTRPYDLDGKSLTVLLAQEEDWAMTEAYIWEKHTLDPRTFSIHFESENVGKPTERRPFTQWEQDFQQAVQKMQMLTQIICERLTIT